MKPFKVDVVIRLNNIFFETAKATLLPESQQELDNLVKILNDNSKMKIEIQGHTDNVGSDASNLTLSDNRAKSVVAYLVGKGIAANRLTAKGYGETKPVATNDTDEGKALNRRVEFKIISIK
jgi:outer membrane protein OmpA-like peptidoglycan-associated protein